MSTFTEAWATYERFFYVIYLIPIAELVLDFKLLVFYQYDNLLPEFNISFSWGDMGDWIDDIDFIGEFIVDICFIGVVIDFLASGDVGSDALIGDYIPIGGILFGDEFNNVGFLIWLVLYVFVFSIKI